MSVKGFCFMLCSTRSKDLFAEHWTCCTQQVISAERHYSVPVLVLATTWLEIVFKGFTGICTFSAREENIDTDWKSVVERRILLSVSDGPKDLLEGSFRR